MQSLGFHLKKNVGWEYIHNGIFLDNKKELSMKRRRATLNTILSEKSQSERLHAVYESNSMTSGKQS